MQRRHSTECVCIPLVATCSVFPVLHAVSCCVLSAHSTFFPALYACRAQHPGSVAGALPAFGLQHSHKPYSFNATALQPGWVQGAIYAPNTRPVWNPPPPPTTMQAAPTLVVPPYASIPNYGKLSHTIAQNSCCWPS